MNHCLTDSLTDNLKSRDAGASKNIFFSGSDPLCRGGGGGQRIFNGPLSFLFIDHVFVGVIQYHLRPLKCDLNQETI